MTSQVYYGLNVHWGVGRGSFGGVTGILQSGEANLKLDEWQGRDQRGNVVAYAGYNPTQTLTLVYYSTDANAAAGNASVSASYPDRGTKITVTSSETGNPFPTGTGYIVQDVLARETNTDATQITLKAISFPGIT